jgi:hypothetical protein
MFHQRSKPRVYTNEMNHFQVRLETGVDAELRLSGYVGDISEEGMCAVIPGEGLLPVEKGSAARGAVSGSYMPEPMPFEARVIWQSESEQRGEKVRFLGLQFAQGVDLPDQILAALMVSGD